jgi:hypothetical protein
MPLSSRNLTFLANGTFFFVATIFGTVNLSPVFGADIEKEIDHLIQFVERTDCQYERNGQLHSGKEAAKHIKRKYKYFKSDIDSAEKFIELSANKSTMSGKSYIVHCPNRPKLRSQEWLLRELKNYRKGMAVKR